MHATEFLQNPENTALTPVIVVCGAEAYLQQRVLRRIIGLLCGDGDDQDDAGVSRFPGENLELKSVLDELRTISMWGDSRTVIVEEADDFVSRFRSGLENYVAAPAKKSTLILVVKSWPKTTRLAKAVAKTHLAVDCSPFKPEKLIPWASETAKRDHGKQLSRNTASLLIELVGTGFGTVVQEITKLATYVGSRDRITEEDIRAVVGGWAT